jgi:hypothetical protein
MLPLYLRIYSPAQVTTFVPDDANLEEGQNQSQVPTESKMPKIQNTKTRDRGKRCDLGCSTQSTAPLVGGLLFRNSFRSSIRTSANLLNASSISSSFRMLKETRMQAARRLLKNEESPGKKRTPWRTAFVGISAAEPLLSPLGTPLDGTDAGRVSFSLSFVIDQCTRTP